MNNNIILTGATGSLGKPISSHLEKDNSVINLAKSLGHDLTDEDFVRTYFKNNKADVLINLFGLNDHVSSDNNSDDADLFKVSLKSFRDYMEVNLTSLFSVCREFARNNETGSIINFSSIYGLVSPRPDLYTNKEKHIGYSVSKSGVIQLTKHLAAHLAPKIRVNCIAPGGVETEEIEEFSKQYSQHVPMKRMMKPQELFGVIDFLCSENSSYTTGAIFVIDGGWTII